MPDCCPFCGSEDYDIDGFVYTCCCGKEFSSPDYIEYDDENDNDEDNDELFDDEDNNRMSIVPNYDPEESDELFEYDGFGDDGYDTGYDNDYI